MAWARTAVNHLINLGHERIGMIGGGISESEPNFFPTPEDRRAGYRAALSDAGLCWHPKYEVNGLYTVPGGERALGDLLGLEQPPTAVFAQSDRMAVGALHALRRAGMSCPDDMSIIGFDDHEVAAALDLTTIAQPMAERGAAAAIQLLAALVGGEPKATLSSPPVLSCDRQRARRTDGTGELHPRPRPIRVVRLPLGRCPGGCSMARSGVALYVAGVPGDGRSVSRYVLFAAVYASGPMAVDGLRQVTSAAKDEVAGPGLLHRDAYGRTKLQESGGSTIVRAALVGLAVGLAAGLGTIMMWATALIGATLGAIVGYSDRTHALRELGSIVGDAVPPGGYAVFAIAARDLATRLSEQFDLAEDMRMIPISGRRMSELARVLSRGNPEVGRALDEPGS